MKAIPANRVNKNNTNIRNYSDGLWRELRKTRFKKANPNGYSNEVEAEERRAAAASDPVFDHDMSRFIAEKLTAQEAEIFRLFLYGGKFGQVEIAAVLGVCQATVANKLARILRMVREYYYGDR